MYDPDTHPNGACDECGSHPEYVTPDAPRVCPISPEHDPYSDGQSNGGDPLPVSA